MMLMLDLETMSTAKNAAIVAIGAVRFDLISGTVRDKSMGGGEGTFYQTINLVSAQKSGGHVEGSTVMWWLQQSDAARKALYESDCLPIENVLKLFNEWVREIPLSGMWGNGSDFDNVILENTYLRLGWTPPWSHKINRCYRTLRALKPEVKRESMEGAGLVAHNALDDAIAQAKHACEIWKKLK